MGAVTRIAAAAMAELDHQLDGPELAVFMAARFTAPVFEVVEVKPVAREGYSSRSDYHVELDDFVRPELIAWALELDLCLVEAHSHGPGYPRFSPSDHDGFADWVPHMRWRLGQRPYAALVRSGSNWDGLAWPGAPGQVEAIEAIEISAATGGANGAPGPSLAPTRTIHTTQRSIDDV